MTQTPSEITSTKAITERSALVWPGKRTEVERVVLPFQTVETVNKPRVDQLRFDFGEWPEKAVELGCKLNVMCGQRLWRLPGASAQ